MCSVDPEGKWRWYLKVEYAILTIAQYVKLGLSLGAVQTRNSTTGAQLKWRGARKRYANFRRATALRAKAAATVCAHEDGSEVCNLHELSVHQFEAKLRASLEKEDEPSAALLIGSPVSSHSNVSSPATGSLRVDVDGRYESPIPSELPSMPSTAAPGAMEDYWEDILEEEEEAAQGTWDSAEVLARWQKKQLLKHYLHRRDRKQSARAQQRLQGQVSGPAKQAGEEVTAHPAMPAAPPLLPSRAPGLSSITAITPVDLERELLTQILNEFGDYVAITHAEAVDMRLLRLFSKQAAALHEHKMRKAREAQDEANGQRVSEPIADEDNDENVFVLSNTDATFKTCKQEGRPTAVTYADAVRLTTLLGEAIAWESFKVSASHKARREAIAAGDGSASTAAAGRAAPSTNSRSLRQQKKASAATAAAAAPPSYANTVQTVNGVKTAVQADCIALMLPNSVEYSLLWWGISRSGPLKTLITDLYDGPTFTENIAEKQRAVDADEAALNERNALVRTAIRAKRAVVPGSSPGSGGAGPDALSSVAVYRPCRTALINTNLSSNAMLFHALSCSGCLAIVLDVQFVPMLFVIANNDDDDDDPSGALRLNVPPQLQRIFLWRWNGKFTAQFTEEMKTLIDQFNTAAYEYLPEALSVPVKRASATRSTPQQGYGSCQRRDDPSVDSVASAPLAAAAVPVLDLFDLVKDDYARGSHIPSGRRSVIGGGEEEKEALVGVPSRFPLLLKRMLSHPPRWLHCDPLHWSPRGTPVAATTPLDEGGNILAGSHNSPSEPPSPACVSLHSVSSASTSTATAQRTTVAHNLFAQLYVRSVRDSMAKTRELADLEAAAATASAVPHRLEHHNGGEHADAAHDASGSQDRQCGQAAVAQAALRARLQARVTALDKQLVAQQNTFNKRMSAALRRFTPVQPILFIYTSGTTGLPKAARFSHLRFFATGFLSQTLQYRGKTREVMERNRAAKGRFQAALKAAVATARAGEMDRSGRAAAGGGDDASLLSAFVDEETRVRRTTATALLAVYTSYVVNAVTFLLWLLGLLFYARRLRYVLSRFVLGITFRKATWLERYNQDAEITEEVSRVSVYNCLPMYHTIGCVFCLGQLMRALEEQQGAQEDLARQLAWHRSFDPQACGAGREGVAWGIVPYEPTRLPTARMVIRSKFSASKFVPDLQSYHITVVQYIGEVLRYAVLYERDHAPSAAQVHKLLQNQLALALEGAEYGNKVADNVSATVLEDEPCSSSTNTTTATTPKKANVGDTEEFGVVHGSVVNDSQLESLTAQIARRVLPDLTNERETLHLVNLFGRWIVPYAFGNGLRKDIWQEVKERLSVSQPVEFYSSTEGNIFLFNLFDIPGAVGHIPRFPGFINWIFDMSYFPIFPFRVLRYDEETQQIWRDPKTNYAKVAAVDEPGEVVGEIIEGYDVFALRRFDGYHQEQPADIASLLTSKNNNSIGTLGAPEAAPAVVNVGDVESKKKVVRHVMWPYSKDAYFRSGDLVKIDDFGFVNFVDRVGETFRWKGENVSTLEVANALSTVHTLTVGVQEAVVYGVSLPGREGRAGMALLTLHRRFLLADGEDARAKTGAKGGDSVHRHPTLQEERLFLQNDLYSFLCGRRRHNGDGTLAQSALPPYATPLFIRVEDTVDDGDEHAVDEVETHKEATKPPTPTAAAANDRDDAVRTTTFKYRKTVLTRQSYSQVPPSTIHNTQGWGEEGQPETSAADGEQDETRPSSRFYVLVTKPDLWMQLSRDPKTNTEVRAGYVPLTAATIDLVGERLSGCGW